MSLEDEIAAWNLKSRDAICAVYDGHSDDPRFLTDIIGLLGDPPLQGGATWLLKHWFDEGGDPVDAELALALFHSLPHLEDWPAKLHVLQCMEHVPVPAATLPLAEDFLRNCLRDEAKFVRAWAYSGFHRLAEQYPQYQREVTGILERALVQESAGSVLARIRRVLERGF